MNNYIMPMARNTRTGETVKAQDLSGRRLQPHQRREAELLAQRLAEQMTDRGPDTWTHLIKTYSA